MPPPSQNLNRVLVVDDNPLILELMRKGLEPHAQVMASTDSTDAMLFCVANPPDLVVCDYRMPGLDGLQFVEHLRTRPDTQMVRVILVAAKADIEDKLRTAVDSVEEFVVKPFYIKDFVARTKKVLDRIAAEKISGQAAKDGVMRGRLSEMNIIDLLQSLELGQKTCGLTVTHSNDVCRMYFAAGNLSHAELERASGNVLGDDAVYEVVRWPDGTFEIDFNLRSDQHTTTRTTQSLLMEALRLLDESGQSTTSGEASY